MAASRFEPLTFHLLDLRSNQLSYHDLMILKCSFWSNEFIMASKNVTSAASSQYMLEVHMSTIYHKGGISLAQPSPLYSVRNEIILAPKKAMAPLWKFEYFDTN